MKIFVSYSRRDAREFAEQISETLEDEHDVFTDIDDIEVGDIWTNIIEDNISTYDIFIVILTFIAYIKCCNCFNNFGPSFNIS